MNKLKKSFTLILFILLSFLCMKNLNAEAAYVTASALRVRSAATTDSTTLIKIYNGETVEVTDTTTISGTGCDGGWYKIKYNNINGYACSTYIKLGTINDSYNTQNFTARVNASTLSVRSAASSSATRDAVLIIGTNVTILDTIKAGNGCDDVWYKVNYHDGKIGYVCSTYIIKKEDITSTDAEYEKLLTDLGFPASYHPYLVYLHKKYPAWQFKAIKTGLKWSNVVSGESGKNLIENTTYSAYRTSSTPREGSSWFESTDGVNAFFLDPRNFLTEKFIFMFENLQYDEATQNTSVVKSIFGSSYLSDDEYINYFMGAGKKFNVSPVHLASRVVQEGGSKSTYAPITGTSTATYNGVLLTGFYNYYNIGAHKDSITDSPTTRGLAYAAGIIGDGTSYGRPWTSREKAIYGGAEFISSGYISKGQYTLYFQKFNTSPTATSSAYTHQYMTNVSAPVSEGSKIYSSYKDNGLIQNAYAFAIPVYTSMPESVSLPTIGDGVNTLNSISINGVNISEFDSDVVTYTHYVTKDTTKLTINANATSSLSKIEGTGEQEIDEDITTLTIKVTSQTGIIKVYTILVTKVSDTTTIKDILSNIEIKINDLNITNIKNGTVINDLSSNIKKYGPSATVIFKSSSGATLSGTSYLATGQQLNISTLAGENKTFNIVVKGDTSGDGKVTILDLLQIQKEILNSKKLSGPYSLAGDTSGDGKVTILDLLQIQKHLVGSKSL